MMLGFYATFAKRASRAVGLYIVLISLIWLTFIMLVINPRYTLPGQPPYILGFFDAYGQSVPAVVKEILFNPKLTLSQVLTWHKLTYLKDLFLPILLLPVFSPKVLLITLSAILINLLSSNPRLSTVYYYYHSSITPFLFFAFVFGLRNLAKKASVFWRCRSSLIMVSILALALAYPVFFNKWFDRGRYLSFRTYFSQWFDRLGEEKKEARKILLHLPPRYSLGVQADFVEHISARKWYFADSQYEGYLPDLVFFDAEGRENFLSQLRNDPHWLQVLEDYHLHLFARRDLVHYLSLEELGHLSPWFPNDRQYLVVSTSSVGEQQCGGDLENNSNYSISLLRGGNFLLTGDLADFERGASYLKKVCSKPPLEYIILATERLVE